MSEFLIKHGEMHPSNQGLIDDALEIRRHVFIEGQNIPEDRDRDGLDNTALHFVGYYNSLPICVARMRTIDLGYDEVGTFDAKIERVGVLPEFRGQGYAKDLMKFILGSINSYAKVRNAVVESQTHAQALYKKLGFEPVGEEFQDAGKPHIKMVKPVRLRPVFHGQRFHPAK